MDSKVIKHPSPLLHAETGLLEEGIGGEGPELYQEQRGSLPESRLELVGGANEA